MVLRNLAEVTLEGNDGDDTFVVKAFALWNSTETIDPAVMGTNVAGGLGSNCIFTNH